MKDSEFIELLNLYLDHEISAEDSARLEGEIRGNLDRRRVYQQYCRMQQACRVIAADFATDEPERASAAEKKVVPFAVNAAAATHRRRLQATYAVGAFAAAACIALVFVSRKGPSADPVSEPSAAVVADSVPAAPTSIDIPVSGTAVPRGLVSLARPGQASSLVANPLLLTGSTQAEAVRAAAVRQADNQLAWLEALQLAPLPERTLPSQDLHFSARLITEGRALGNRASAGAKQPEPGEEMTTFQIVK